MKKPDPHWGLPLCGTRSVGQHQKGKAKGFPSHLNVSSLGLPVLIRRVGGRCHRKEIAINFLSRLVRE
jgi:hypothetical protein